MAPFSLYGERFLSSSFPSLETGRLSPVGSFAGYLEALKEARRLRPELLESFF